MKKSRALGEKEKLLVEYLQIACPGRDMTVSSEELEAAMQMSANQLRHKINRLRRKKYPIASSQEGYFYAETAGEVYTTIRRLRSMVKGLEAAIQGLEESLELFQESRSGGDGP